MTKTTKSRICFIAALLILVGCGDNHPKYKTDGERVKVIDGCEYLAWDTYYGYESMTHKGNCTNSAHNYRE